MVAMRHHSFFNIKIVIKIYIYILIFIMIYIIIDI